MADSGRHWRERPLGVVVVVEVVRGAGRHRHGHLHLLTRQGLGRGSQGTRGHSLQAHPRAVAVAAASAPAAIQVGLVHRRVGHARRGQHHGGVQVLQQHQAAARISKRLPGDTTEEGEG